MVSAELNYLHRWKLRSDGAPKSIFLHRGSLKKSFKLANTGRVAHFAQSLCFDLTNALTSDLKLPAYFFKRSAIAVDQPETLLEHLPLAICQGLKHVFDFLLQ